MATHKAVYDFEPDEEGEIKLTIGDRVNLVDNFGDGWVEVTNLETGNKGVVPENYIELSSRPPSDRSSPVPPAPFPPPPVIQPINSIPPHVTDQYSKPEHWEVVLAYAAQKDDEIDLVKGHDVISKSPPQGGFIEVQNMTGFGEKGWVPLANLKKKDLGGPIGLAPNPPPSNNNTLDRNLGPASYNTFGRAMSDYGGGGDQNGDPYKPDPIDHCVGTSMFGAFSKTGQEKFLLGKALENEKLTQAEIRYDKAKIRVKGVTPVWHVDAQDRDGDWRITVLGLEKDPKGKSYFRVSADPWPSSWVQETLTDVGGVQRKVDDFKWLDVSLRNKYPFIYIPTLKQDSSNPSELAMREWCQYISQHPVIRYSHYVKIFLTIIEKDMFKKATKELQKGDKNVKEQLMRLIEVDDDCKVAKDLQITMANSQRQIVQAQNSYTSTTLSLQNTLLTISDSAQAQKVAFQNLQEELINFAKEQRAIGVMGACTMADAVNQVVDIIGPSQTSETDLLQICDAKTQNQFRFRNNHVTYTECTGMWKDHGAYTFGALGAKYEEIIKQKKMENSRLSDSQYYNARARAQNLMAIQSAEHNHQLRANNNNLKETMIQYLTTQIKFMRQELTCYEQMLENFESIEIPE